MATYEQKKQRALQLLQSTLAMAQQLKQPDYIKPLQDAAKRLNDGQFMVVVCGEFRRGKSSLLNAFLNEIQDLFPVDISITTNLVSTVAYNPVEKITVLIGSPDADNLKPLSIKRNEIHLYVTEKDNPGNEREARLMQIEVSNEHLKQGLILVDTPGVGGLYARHTDVTYGFIPQADAVIYVSDAFQPLSNEDLRFIKDRILKHTDHILFVLTKKDKVPGYKDIIKSNREKLAVTLGRPSEAITIVPVSSYSKRSYLKTHDPEDLEDSNFPFLERTLWQFVNAGRGRILLAKAVSTMSQAAADMRRPLQAEFDAYQAENKQKLEEIESSLDEAQRYLRDLQDNNAQWQAQLRDGMEDIRQDMQREFERGFNTIRRNVDGYLSEAKVLEQPELVLPPLQRDINDLLYKLDRGLSEAAADLQSRIEFATGLALNPFEPDALQNQVRTLTLQGLPPAPKQNSSWDKIVTVGQRASMSESFGHRIGRIAGSILSFFGHPIIGVAVDIVSSVFSAKSGAKQALQQMREHDRQHILHYLMTMLADSQKEYGYDLSKSIKGLERNMRDDLLDKIKRERSSRERALRSFQDARQLNSSQAQARIAVLRAPLQQFDQLQRGLELLMQETMNDDDDPPGMNTSNQRASHSQSSGGTSAHAPGENSDTGGWADA